MTALWVRFLALAGAVVLAVFWSPLGAVLVLLVLSVITALIREGWAAERQQGAASAGRHRRGGAA